MWARLARCGYDAIEISGEPARSDPREVRPLLEHHGIRCCGSVTLMTDRRDLFLRDHASGDVGAEYYDRCIERTIAPLRQFLSGR